MGIAPWHGSSGLNQRLGTTVPTPLLSTISTSYTWHHNLAQKTSSMGCTKHPIHTDKEPIASCPFPVLRV